MGCTLPLGVLAAPGAQWGRTADGQNPALPIIRNRVPLKGSIRVTIRDL